MTKIKSTKGKQRPTKHTQKNKDRVTRTSLITGVELMCSGRVAVPAPLSLFPRGIYIYMCVCVVSIVAPFL